MRAYIVDVDALGGSASLETSRVGDGGLGAWTSIAGVLGIGAFVSLVGVGDLGLGASLGDLWSIEAAMSLTGSWSGTETPATWHVFGIDGPSPFSTNTDVPDNATTWLGLCIKHNGSRCKSASTSSALSPSRSAS